MRLLRLKQFAVQPAWFDRLGSNQETWFGITLTICAIGLWTFVRPYSGIWHDSALYTGQVLFHQHPQAFGQDLFFAYGSQDRFTIFSPLIDFLSRTFGWTGLLTALLVGTQIAFMVALIALLRRLVPLPLAAIGIAVAGAAPHYGGWWIFSYAEPFFTARSLTEPLVLVAMMVMLDRSYLLSALLLIVATAFHPLIALAGWGVLALYVLEERPRLWAVAGLGIVGLFIAGWIGVKPFDGLFVQFDDAWWGVIYKRLAFILPQEWFSSDWDAVGFDTLVLGFVSYLAAPHVARLARAVLAIELLGIAAAAFAGEVFYVSLLTAAQLWRTQWIGHLLAGCLAPWLIWRLRSQGPFAWLGMALLLVSVAFGRQWGAVWLLPVVAACFMYSLRSPKTTTIMRVFIMILAAVAIGAALVQAFEFANYRHFMRDGDDISRWVLRNFEFPSVCFFVISAMALLFAYAPRVATLLSVATLVTSMVLWDQRWPWYRYVDSHIDEVHPFSAFIPEGQSVYWQGELVTVWLVLKRAAYFTEAQGSGTVFNRGTAIEFARRSDKINVLGTQETACRVIRDFLGDRDCAPTVDVLRDVCTDGPDFLVLRSGPKDKYLSSWSFEDGSGDPKKFFLYSCKALLAEPRVKSDGKP